MKKSDLHLNNKFSIIKEKNKYVNGDTGLAHNISDLIKKETDI